MGWLVLAVVHWAVPEWKLGLFRDLHVPIWPVNGRFRYLEGFAPQAVTEFFYFDEMVSSLAAIENEVSLEEPIIGAIRFIKGRK